MQLSEEVSHLKMIEHLNHHYEHVSHHLHKLRGALWKFSREMDAALLIAAAVTETEPRGAESSVKAGLRGQVSS